MEAHEVPPLGDEEVIQVTNENTCVNDEHKDRANGVDDFAREGDSYEWILPAHPLSAPLQLAASLI